MANSHRSRRRTAKRPPPRSDFAEAKPSRQSRLAEVTPLLTSVVQFIAAAKPGDPRIEARRRLSGLAPALTGGDHLVLHHPGTLCAGEAAQLF